MNKEDFVSLEVAKLLKEKGFNEPCNSAYDKKGNIGTNTTLINWNKEYDWAVSRPTLYEAAKWLRDKHAIHISIEWDVDGFCSSITIRDEDGLFVESSYHIYYKSYEEALNAGILEALKMI